MTGRASKLRNEAKIQSRAYGLLASAAVNAALLWALVYQPWNPSGRNRSDERGLVAFDVSLVDTAEGGRERPHASLVPNEDRGVSLADAGTTPRDEPLQQRRSSPVRLNGDAQTLSDGVDLSAAPVSGALSSAYQQAVREHVMRFSFYPDGARADRMKGVVMVGVELTRDGHVSSAWIERSSGYGPLDDAALLVIRHADPMPVIPVSLPNQLVLSVPLEFLPPRLAMRVFAADPII